MYNLLPFGLFVEIGRSAGLCVQIQQWPSYMDQHNFGKAYFSSFEATITYKVIVKCK